MALENPQLGSPWVSVHPTYARMLCLVLRGLQVDVDAMLASIGLNWAELSVTDQMLSFDAMQSIGLAAIRTSQRPWLGLDMGQALQVSVHGPLGYAVASSRDLRQAFETLERHGNLRNEAISFELETVRGGAVLRVHEKADLGDLRHAVLDVVFAAGLKLIELVASSGLERITIDLPRPEPAWSDRYRRIFPGQLRFNTSHLAIRVDDALLDTPSFTADVHDFEAACRECERAQAQSEQSHDPTVAFKVRELLKSKPDTYPSLEDIAAQLHVSTRTLMRKLKAEGSSYQALLDELRQERAAWYLQHTRLSVEDIAARLGYADTSNFSRTFRRWFGITPVQMRTQGASDATDHL
jgi:AraC-like DNA-binding protein